MEEVVISTSRTEKGYSGSCELLPGWVVAFSGDFSGFIDYVRESIDFFVDCAKEDKEEYPAVFDQSYNLVFKMDIQSILYCYDKILSRAALSRLTGINERQLAGRQLFRERLFSQETAGGWMDLMPTGLPGEAEVWWGHMHLDEDGRARFRHNFRSYYFLLTPLHGLNSEFEATVYFEEKDPNQKEWDIGWGLARPTYGRTISSGAVPYISRQILVRDLAKQPSHSFNLKTGPENVVITVDGNEILSSPCKEFFASYEFGECIMSNGDVLPVWKLFKNTAFSGYHYRRVPAKEESGAEGRNPQAPAEALKAAIAPLATSMSEIVKNKAYSGGWGYDEKTAVVISAEDEISGVELERPFLLLRSQSEVIAALEKTKLGTKDDIDAVVPTVKSQGLISSGGRSYDSIEYEVCVKLTNGVVFTYDAECWFDITSFFGK